MLFAGTSMLASSCDFENAGENKAHSCGDGVENAGEACDDGNQVAGDGCSPECIRSGTHVDCVTLLEDNRYKVATALLPLADGTFLVGGHADGRGWIGRFDGSGAQLWFENIASMNPPSRSVVPDLVTDGQDGAWALVDYVDIDMVLLELFDGGGNTERIVDIAAEVGFPVTPQVLEYGDTSLWLGGKVWAGGSRHDIWLGRYDLASGEITTVLHEDHLGFDDAIDVSGRRSTELAFAATLRTSPDLEVNATDILLLRFDLQGNELGRTVSAADPESLHIRVALGITPDPTGGWIVAGVQLPLDQVARSQVWATRFEPTPSWQWTSADILHDDEGASFGGVVASEAGMILAGALRTFEDGAYLSQAWVGGFDLGGTPRWQHTHFEAGYRNYRDMELALDSAARVRVVGKAWQEQDPDPSRPSLLESCIVAQ